MDFFHLAVCIYDPTMSFQGWIAHFLLALSISSLSGWATVYSFTYWRTSWPLPQDRDLRSSECSCSEAHSLGCLYLCKKNSPLSPPISTFELKWRAMLGEFSSIHLSKHSGFSQCHFREWILFRPLWNCEDLLKMGFSETELSFGLIKT